MLTQDELKQLRDIVREEIMLSTNEAKKDIEANITISQMHIRSEIVEVQKRQKDIDLGVIQLDKKTTKNLERIENKLDKGFSSLKNDVKTAINFFNRDDVEMEKRISKIEDHLNLSAE